MKRCAVSMPVEIIPYDGSSGLKTGSRVSEIDLNYFAMYWDELYIPDNNMVSFGLPNQQKLMDTGFLKRPMYAPSSISGMQEVNRFLGSIQGELVKTLRGNHRDTDFVIHNIGDDGLETEKIDSEKIRTVRIELMNALPVPEIGTDIERILNFKLKRRDELEGLHLLIEELYDEVAKSGDLNLAKAKSFSRLRVAIEALNKTALEKFFSARSFSISFDNEFSLGDAWSAFQFSGAAYSASNGNLGGTLLQLGSALVPQLMSKVKVSQKSVKKGDYKKLKYLSKASSAGVIKK